MQDDNQIVQTDVVDDGTTVTETDTFADGTTVTTINDSDAILDDASDTADIDAAIALEENGDLLASEKLVTDFADGTTQVDDGVTTTTYNTDQTAFSEPTDRRTYADDEADANIHNGITDITVVDTYTDGTVVSDDGIMTETDAPDGTVTLTPDDQDLDLDLDDDDDDDGADDGPVIVAPLYADGLSNAGDLPDGTIVDDGNVSNVMGEADAAAAFGGTPVVTDAGVIDLLDEEDDD